MHLAEMHRMRPLANLHPLERRRGEKEKEKDARERETEQAQFLLESTNCEGRVVRIYPAFSCELAAALKRRKKRK